MWSLSGVKGNVVGNVGRLGREVCHHQKASTVYTEPCCVCVRGGGRGRNRNVKVKHG